MCGCKSGGNNNFKSRALIPNQVKGQNTSPVVQPPNVVQAQNFTTPGLSPQSDEMTPDRRRIERLQREAIRRSLGK